MVIQWENNRVLVGNDYMREDSNRMLSTLHNITEVKGYKDVIVDFSECTRAFSSEMLALCARSMCYWKSGIDISLVLPKDSDLRRLFVNTNWAHFIDPHSHEESRYRGYTHAPTMRFSSGIEQSLAVNKILDILLAAIQHFKRDDIRYIEWAINEITDNVINHSQSPVGGFIQVTNYRQREQIQLVVADAGLGIPTTLRPSHPELHTDAEALHAAIREGVTRDKRIGQGNGLYGTWSICQKTEGDFAVQSGYATLISPKRAEVHSQSTPVPMKGTLFSARIGYSEKFDLSNALTFAGRPHVPTDYIDTHFEQDADGNVKFALREESPGFGSRALGDPVRRKLVNLVDMAGEGKVIVDLEGVILISSSYADEVFGKLFVDLGPMQFMHRVELRNVDPLVRDLIDRAIMQRMTA